ncbi:TPA: hypothetical protein O7Y06_002859 [Salmonella enterica]|nr:hypothetical protein [Salmonella enterica]ECB3848103.1 hypothetical protein [Salmonella enterica subsp. enterica serovar Newport]EDA8242572.1 hypothetical protein [Salmonella enterica subsp. enterica serovar Reading]EDT6461719.1 hypothetical protein [Salmonella enterica subsp. enterica]EEC4936643.1 hypothetical protein [Salmonella enterica subsp. enterica serovar Kasenyi]
MLKPVSVHTSRFHHHRSEPAKTGHAVRRIIQRLSRCMPSFYMKGASQKFPDAGIQERAVRSCHQNMSAPGTGPLSLKPLSDGAHIDVSAPGITASARSKLEKEFNISVTPVYISGKEIGYVFGDSPENINQIHLTCHGYGCNQRDFVKPAGVSLKFIVPENTLAMVEDGEVIRKVAEGRIEYRDPDEQICDAGSTRTVKDYLLEAVTGDHHTRITHNADGLAFYIKQLKDTGKPVNVMTLNPNATGIHLTDVIQGLNDTFRQVPGLICGHCRPENASATVQRV